MILNIFKPAVWTSFDVVKEVRNVLGVKKAGHAGTLDPLAEGVLIVLTDKDTKKQQEIMNSKKEYLAYIALGGTTSSYDLETKITETDQNINLENILEKLDYVLRKYKGKIVQTVPAYSAVKVKGKRLYKKARKGKVNLQNLPSREIEIYELENLGVYRQDGFVILKLRVLCSSGTYIRSLAYDIGQDLGVGGFLYYLLRTKVGKYCVEDSICLED